MREHVFKTKEGKLFLVYCPRCGKENWAPRVSEGVCAWCGYKATEEDITHET